MRHFSEIHQQALTAIYTDLISPLFAERGQGRTYPSETGGFYRSVHAKPFVLSSRHEADLSGALQAKGHVPEHARLHGGVHALPEAPEDLLIEMFPARSSRRDRVRLSVITDGGVRELGEVAFSFKDGDNGVEVDSEVRVPDSAEAEAAIAEIVRVLTVIKDARPAPSEDRPDW